jgi:deoxycytidylate deaminase
MSEKQLEASTPLVRQSLDLSSLNQIHSDNLTYEDISGMDSALREAQLSSHTTQVGASLLGVSAFNRQVGSSQHHAETLAILSCARLGLRTQDATMYAPWAACQSCALAIIGAGIRRVVVHKSLMEKTPDRWLTSVSSGLDLLWSHSVRVDMVDHNSGFDILMDGKVVKV